MLFMVLKAVLFLFCIGNSLLYANSVLSPGDVLFIESWPDRQYTRYVTVDNAGYVSFPFFDDRIKASGKTLSDFQQSFDSLMNVKLPMINFVVRFSGHTSIKVSVTGAVQYPGEYIFPSGARVSTILKQLDMRNFRDAPYHQISSFDDLTMRHSFDRGNMAARQEPYRDFVHEKPELHRFQVDDFLFSSRVSFRNVEIRRGDTVIVCDVTSFHSFGDISHNPILKNGDIVFFRYRESVAFLKGAVNQPASYEILEGETVHDLIKLAGGLQIAHAENVIEIYNPRTGNFRRANLEETKTIYAEPFDHVYIPFDWKNKATKAVFIEGEIAFPGFYPIVGELTLDSLIQRAGGVTEMADIYATTITRVLEVAVGPFPRQEKLATDLSIVRLSTPSAGQVNLNIPLKNYDKVVIPPMRSVVHVMGMVGRPGSYTWQAGRSANYYLELAGGHSAFSNKAHTRVIRAKDGEIVPLSAVDEIEQGDVIYVPEFIPYTERAGFRLAREVVSMLGILASALSAAIIYDRIRE